MSNRLVITKRSFKLLEAVSMTGEMKMGFRELPDGLVEIELDDQVFEALMDVNSDPDAAIRIIIMRMLANEAD